MQQNSISIAQCEHPTQNPPVSIHPRPCPGLSWQPHGNSRTWRGQRSWPWRICPPLCPSDRSVAAEHRRRCEQGCERPPQSRGWWSDFGSGWATARSGPSVDRGAPLYTQTGIDWLIDGFNFNLSPANHNDYISGLTEKNKTKHVYILDSFGA